MLRWLLLLHAHDIAQPSALILASNSFAIFASLLESLAPIRDAWLVNAAQVGHRDVKTLHLLFLELLVQRFVVGVDRWHVDVTNWCYGEEE